MPGRLQTAALELPRGQAASPDSVVLRCVAGRCTPEQEAMGDVDWDSVLKVAERESVLPLLARCFDGPNAELLPEPVRRRLRQAFLESAAAGMALACELGRVIAHFRDVGIPALAFKGPVLGTQIYGTVCWRQCEDLDILVSPRDWKRALAELQMLGYTPDPAPARFAKHELRMFAGADQNRAVVDLHRALMPGWCGFHLDFDELHRRAETVAVCGTPVPTPCPEDLLLLLCVHAAKHGWTHLKWAADIAELLRTRPTFDWDSVLQTARRLRAHRRLLVGVALAAQLFEVSLPAAVASAIRRDPSAKRLTAELYAGRPAALGNWSHMRLLIVICDDWRGRLRVWLQLARLTVRLTDADRSWLSRPARLLRVHGPAIARVLRSSPVSTTAASAGRKPGGRAEALAPQGASGSRDAAATSRAWEESQPR